MRSPLEKKTINNDSTIHFAGEAKRVKCDVPREGEPASGLPCNSGNHGAGCPRPGIGASTLMCALFEYRLNSQRREVGRLEIVKRDPDASQTNSLLYPDAVHGIVWQFALGTCAIAGIAHVTSVFLSLAPPSTTLSAYRPILRLNAEVGCSSRAWLRRPSGAPSLERVCQLSR